MTIYLRSQAEYAEFAINNVQLGGHHLTVTRYYPQQDPQFYSSPVYQRLGQYIGQDHIVFDPQTFQPFGATPTAQSFAQAMATVLRNALR